MIRWHLCGALVLLVCSAMLLGWLGIAPFSGRALVLLLMLAIALCWVWLQFARQQQQTALVLKALANQDISFKLRQQPQLQALLQDVQQQLVLSRQQAEIRAQYLAALLVQLDVAVLEFDQDNRLLQANPAAERLLGKMLLLQAELGITAESAPPLSLLWHKLQQKKPQQQGELVWVQQGIQDRLAFSLVQSHIQGKPRKLLTLQSIQQQLLQQEVKAYQQLTRVLTHEIANSITPMVSLAQSSLALLPQADTQLDAETHADLRLASQTIAQRGQHLSQFIQSFKQLSAPVQAELQPVDLWLLLTHVQRLLAQELNQIQCNLQFPDPVPTLWLDPALSTQVLINLIKNAVEALHTTPQATITCTLHFQDRWLLDIQDNGAGVASSAVDKLFIPFFTTKSSGSGIGLSLARMLMQAQGGELSYIEQPSGACFRLRLS